LVDPLAPEPVRARVAAALSEWNEIVGGAFAGCVVDASKRHFAGHLTSCQIDDFRVIRVRAQPSRVSRWLTGQPSRSSGSVLLHLQSFGRSINQQCGRTLPIRSGEAAICDPDRAYRVDFITPYEMYVLELSTARLALHEPGFDLDRFAGQRVDPLRSRLLLAFLRAAWRQRRCLQDDEEWRDCVSRTCIDLATRSVSRTAPQGESGAALDMQRSVVAHIRRHLADPTLRTSTLARALGISPRSVQGVFERLTTTASAFILEARLQRAVERLTADRYASITELAFECGFSDSGYFSRCFREHFGLSPRDYRSQRRASTPAADSMAE